MSDIQLLVVVIIAGASFVRGAVGFGDALFAMPLLAFIAPTTFSAPLVALSAFLMAIVLLMKEWRHMEFRAAAVLTISGMLGVPIGNMVLRFGNDQVVKMFLGAAVFLFAAWSLKKPTIVKLETNRTSPLFGFASGILGGAYNIAGPPLVIYATLRHWTPQQQRSMMQAYCLVSSVWVLTFHTMNGMVTTSVLNHFFVSAPVLIAATLLGQRTTKNMATDKFRNWVNVCLMLSGLALLVSCLR